MVDDWDLRRTGRSCVKDAEGPDAPGGRRIVVTGQLRSSEIRVRRGGIAMLSAMFSRAYWDDLRRAHRGGRLPHRRRPGPHGLRTSQPAARAAPGGTRCRGGADGEQTQGEQPARARSAVIPDAGTHASLRAGPHAARPRRRAEHQVQPRLAVHGRPAAGERAGSRRRAGNQPRGPAPRADRVRHHRCGPGRAARLAARAGRGAAARVSALRGRALADQRAAAQRGSHPTTGAAPPGWPRSAPRSRAIIERTLRPEACPGCS